MEDSLKRNILDQLEQTSYIDKKDSIKEKEILDKQEKEISAYKSQIINNIRLIW